MEVSSNGRYLQYRNGDPFFWQGDTAWLLLQRLNRSETEAYLADRQVKGFNVIQIMVLHNLSETTEYGVTAFIDNDPIQPRITPGRDPNNGDAYDYWDHVDFVVDQAAAKGLFLAMVPTWGSIVKAGTFTVPGARAYAKFLARRYRDKPNIIWLNGGDVRGDQHTEIWQTLGHTLHTLDPHHLMTFHPFGRTQSSQWFHRESWLDLNMFQSGHRRYDQRRPSDDPNTWKGEDNWRYVLEDCAHVPAKPTLDGEPSYEGIPQGLHDPNEPYWQARDARRYAYWSVFAGACGHTYGNSAVMQMHSPKYGKGEYGVRQTWRQGLHDPGAGQIQHLKALMLSRPYFERVFAPSLIAANPGQRYERILATRGKGYALVYTYTGRAFDIVFGKLSGERIKAWWYNPRNGRADFIGLFPNQGIRHFDPPGSPAPGHDWVLVLDDASQAFSPPGQRTVP